MAKVIRISAKRVGLALLRLDGQVARGTLKAIHETAIYGTTQVEKSISRIKPRKPVATNTYRQSWAWKKIKNGAVIGNPTVQAYFVEVGRKPGKAPPLRPILEWVRVKKLARRAHLKTARKSIQKRIRAEKAKLRKEAKAAREEAKAQAKAKRAAAKRGYKSRPKQGRESLPERRRSQAQERGKGRAKVSSKAATARRRAALKAKLKKVGRATKERVREHAERHIALSIALKIAQRGTPGRYVLRKSLPKIGKFLNRQTRKQVRAALQKHRG